MFDLIVHNTLLVAGVIIGLGVLAVGAALAVFIPIAIIGSVSDWLNKSMGFGEFMNGIIKFFLVGLVAIGLINLLFY